MFITVVTNKKFPLDTGTNGTVTSGSVHNIKHYNIIADICLNSDQRPPSALFPKIIISKKLKINPTLKKKNVTEQQSWHQTVI